jgi:sec-independent protein translocase protein TatA
VGHYLCDKPRDGRWPSPPRVGWERSMSIGIWQVVLILVIVLIIFGAGRLPQVMGDVAKGVKSFKSGLKDEEAPRPIADEAQTRSEAVRKDEHASG